MGLRTITVTPNNMENKQHAITQDPKPTLTSLDSQEKEKWDT